LWCKILIEFQEQEKNEQIANIASNGILKYVVSLNNNFKSAHNSKDTSSLALKYANEHAKDRVENIVQEVTRAFTKSAQDLLEVIVKLSFLEIEAGVVPLLFTSAWIDDEQQLTGMMLATMEDYFGSYKKWFFNPTYMKLGIRGAFDYLLDLYFEKFLWAVHKSYNTLTDYVPSKLKSNKGKKEKKQKKEKKSYIATLSNNDMLIKSMSRDVNLIKNIAGEKYMSHINKNYMEKLDTQFGLLFNLIKIPKMDFETLLHPIHEHFGNMGKHLLNAVLSIREDCDSKFKKEIYSIYTDFIISKEQKK